GIAVQTLAAQRALHGHRQRAELIDGLVVALLARPREDLVVVETADVLHGGGDVAPRCVQAAGNRGGLRLVGIYRADDAVGGISMQSVAHDQPGWLLR